MLYMIHCLGCVSGFKIILQPSSKDRCVKRTGKNNMAMISPRFSAVRWLFFRLAGAVGRQRALLYGKQRICPCNFALAYFHVSWLSDFIFYLKPSYKSLHQSFFYSFITILASESGVALDYCTIFPYTLSFRHFTFTFKHLSRDY